MSRILFFLLGFFIVTSSFSQPTELIAKAVDGSIFIEHKILPKENWYSIGRIYELSPKEIASFNRLSMEKGLGIGQSIRIPMLASNFDQQSPVATGIPVVHLVQPKEGLFRIAASYGIPISRIRGWNAFTSDQVRVGDKVIVGFLKSASKNIDNALSGSKKPESDVIKSNATILNQQKENPRMSVSEKENVVSRDLPQQSGIKKEVVSNVSLPEPKNQPVVSSGTKTGVGFFSALFNQQASGGTERHLEAFIYGIFKSTSGWDDKKYYVLLNDVVPGTAVKISVKGTDRVVYAKVLGAVPPGKESEGLSMRMSNATAAALGLSDTNAQLILDWFN